MPTTVSAFLTQFANRAGLDITPFKAVLDDPKISTTELPDEYVTTVTGALMTEREAKDNLKVKNHFMANFLDPLDQKFMQIADELGDPDFKKELTDTKSSYLKNDKVIAKYKALLEAEKKADKSGSDKDKQAVIAKYEALQAEMNTTKATYEAKLAEKDERYNNTLTDFEIKNLLNSYNYPTGQYPKDFYMTAAQVKYAEGLKQKGAIQKLTENGLELVLASSPDLKYTENNQYVSPKQFMDRIVSENKLIEVTPAPNPNPAPRPGNPNPAPGQRPLNLTMLQQAVEAQNADPAQA